MMLNLMAAVPTHSQSMIMEGVEALVGLQQIVLEGNGKFQLHFESGATISLVRNAIVAAFLQSDAQVLLMLDSDQAVHPGTIARMIEFEQPVVGVIYPTRKYDWSQVKIDENTSVDRIVQQAARFVGWLETKDDGEVSLVQGFSLAEHVGTGILVLRREVFLKMMEFYPELKGRGFAEDAYPKYSSGGRWGFFNPLENENGVPLSEDISFCRRWGATGGKIWAEVTAITSHIGRHPFSGSYLDFLTARSAT